MHKQDQFPIAIQSDWGYNVVTIKVLREGNKQYKATTSPLLLNSAYGREPSDQQMALGFLESDWHIINCIAFDKLPGIWYDLLAIE